MMSDISIVSFSFTEVVLAWRTRRGVGKPLSFIDFAAELNVSPQTINYWERGQFTPAIKTLNAIIADHPPTAWQNHFARDLRHALYPELAPYSDIGKLLEAIQPS